MHYRLIGVGNTYTFELSGSGLLSVGRAVTNDCAVVDPTISRKHADLKVTPGGVEVMDAGSSNGTFVNGVQIDKSLLVPGDEVTFGKVVFRLEQVTPARPAPTPAPAGKAGGATIVRQIPRPAKRSPSAARRSSTTRPRVRTRRSATGAASRSSSRSRRG